MNRLWRDALPLVPAILLCGVALVQLHLTRAHSFPPWKGGGFGMFSTIDSANGRLLRVWITGPDGTRQIDLPEGLGDTVAETITMPSRRRMEDLARRVAEKKRAEGEGVSQVRIALWRSEYDVQALTPRLDPIREVVVDVPGTRTR